MGWITGELPVSPWRVLPESFDDKSFFMCLKLDEMNPTSKCSNSLSFWNQKELQIAWECKQLMFLSDSLYPSPILHGFLREGGRQLDGAVWVRRAFSVWSERCKAVPHAFALWSGSSSDTCWFPFLLYFRIMLYDVSTPIQPCNKQANKSCHTFYTEKAYCSLPWLQWQAWGPMKAITCVKHCHGYRQG